MKTLLTTLLLLISTTIVAQTSERGDNINFGWLRFTTTTDSVTTKIVYQNEMYDVCIKEDTMYQFDIKPDKIIFTKMLKKEFDEKLYSKEIISEARMKQLIDYIEKDPKSNVVYWKGCRTNNPRNHYNN